MFLRADLLSALAVPLGIGLVLNAAPVQGPVETSMPTPTWEPVSFSEQILPIFEARCTECHGTVSAELGLNLATYEGAMAGSDYGSVIEPGNPDGSLIIDMIASGDMPSEGDPMPPDELELLRTWIEEGAENN